MIYIVLGPSGCGKGTQAKMLAEKLGLPTVSTGELIRRGAAAGNPEAVKAKELADQGQWSPDDLVNKILAEGLEQIDLAQGFVLDGFPRRLGQAVWFDEYLKEKSLGLSVTAVLHLETSVDESLKRIQGRIKVDAQEGQVRSDETDLAVRGRFESYNQTISPIKDYYQDQSKLILINNHQSIEAVQAEVCLKLGLAPVAF